MGIKEVLDLYRPRLKQLMQTDIKDPETVRIIKGGKDGKPPETAPNLEDELRYLGEIIIENTQRRERVRGALTNLEKVLGEREGITRLHGDG